MFRASSFTFDSYEIDAVRSILVCTYKVQFESGAIRTYTDRLHVPGITKEMWSVVPHSVLKPALEALLLILGINYWCVFPTKNIYINGFTLSKSQAEFWNTIYTEGLSEFFYEMNIDFRGLVSFPYDTTVQASVPELYPRPHRSLLLNGAGKDSILSAELLKKAGTPFDYFAFAPTPAHERIRALVGVESVNVTRRHDWRLEPYMLAFGTSRAYPSVTTFTFIAVLLAIAKGYDSIVFSNERSADFGNLTYLGLSVNHQWCKSSDAERITNDYIQHFITPSVATVSPLRSFSELEIVRQFVNYPKYLHDVTSCNTYFALPRSAQFFSRKSFWCKSCPKCVFLFACYAAFLPKKEVVAMFGADLYNRKRLLSLFRRILGIEGFKPLDCVGEPEEMILAMHYAYKKGEYADEPALTLFEEYFSNRTDFLEMKQKVLSG